MNSWQFYQYTQYPNNLNLHDEVQLRGLIKDYPYFQAAHLLLAKCLKNQDNYSFEKQLKLAALYAPNRSLLYSLLKAANKPVMIEEISFPVAKTVDETLVTPENEAIETTEDILPVEAEILDENVTSILETTEETIEQIDAPVENTQTPVEETIEPELPDGVTYITETLTPVIAEETIEQEIVMEEAPIENTAIEEPLVEETGTVADWVEQPISEEPAIEEPLVEETETVADLVEHPIVEEPVIEETLEQEIVVEELYIEPANEAMLEEVEMPVAERPFSEWLKQTASSNSSVFMRDKPMGILLKQPTADYIIPSKPLDSASEQSMLSVAKQESVQAPKPTFSDDILEKFMSSNPTISRPKTSFFNPSTAAKKSLEPHEDLATETLAKIALKQNNYLKAIKIYEKLSLKFPEKFTIFAAQIKKIKTENNLE